MEHSGGEQQRIYLAQALVQRPKVLLLDEPTNHLDLAYQKELLDLLSKSAKEEGLTVIAILHDLNLASLYCDRLLLMEDGQIKQLDNPETVLSEELINPVYRTEVIKQPHSTIAKPQLHLIPGKQEISVDEIVKVDASSLDVAENYLSIRLDTPIKSLSSSVIGSGVGWYKNFVNQHVTKVESNLNDKEELQRFFKEKNYRPNQTVATMTFGEEKLHTSTLYEENDYSVFVVLSAGIHSKKGSKRINGINIWIIINGNVTDAVFIQGMISAAEGKTKALIEQKPNHKMNHANSSDTTTGKIVVAATQQGRKLHDQETLMQVRKEIEKAVYREVNKLFQAL
jgi:iron complex transport system ATP-binding protein